jgi:O-antigen ligase
MINYKNHYASLFFWVISLAFIFLPFPKDSLSSLTIMLIAVVWLAGGNWKEKWQNIKKHWVQILVISTPFLIPCFAFLIRQDDFDIENINKKIPFLIMAIVFSSLRFTKKDLHKLLHIFVWAVCIASLFAVGKYVYFQLNNLGGELYYDSFAKFLEKQATYFALYVVVCLCFLMYQLIHLNEKRQIINVVKQVFLFSMLLILSTRVSIVAYAIGLLFIVIPIIKELKKNVAVKILLPVLILVACLIFVKSNNFVKRFDSISGIATNKTEWQIRVLHWKSVLITALDQNWLIGNIHENSNEQLFENYKKIGFNEGINQKYNAHNQFLEQLLYFGFIGFLALILTVGYPLFYGWKSKNHLVMAIMMVFLIFMMTESLLQRLSGINLLALLLPIFLNKSFGLTENAQHEKLHIK